MRVSKWQQNIFGWTILLTYRALSAIAWSTESNCLCMHLSYACDFVSGFEFNNIPPILQPVNLYILHLCSLWSQPIPQNKRHEKFSQCAQSLLLLCMSRTAGWTEQNPMHILYIPFHSLSTDCEAESVHAQLRRPHCLQSTTWQAIRSPPAPSR